MTKTIIFSRPRINSFHANLLQQSIAQTNSTHPKVFYNPYELAKTAKFVEITYQKSVQPNPYSGYYIVGNGFNLYSSENKLKNNSAHKRERILKTYLPGKYKLSGRFDVPQNSVIVKSDLIIIKH